MLRALAAVTYIVLRGCRCQKASSGVCRLALACRSEQAQPSRDLVVGEPAFETLSGAIRLGVVDLRRSLGPGSLIGLFISTRSGEETSFGRPEQT